jgi:MoaA/NifB/PqqE/SkfB family radical SAM enzyme
MDSLPIQATNSLALWHWHIEISSKCTLRCPRCARQEVPHSLVNTELDFDFFERNFKPDFVKQHVRKITFCGDDGDPIYAHDLIPVIAYFKSIQSDIEIVIVTNGSHKSEYWWKSLALQLGNTDSVHFSIDGWDNKSNNQYRVNSDYNSIIAGVKTLRAHSRCQIIWAAIAFKFNQKYIQHMKNQALDLGFDRFQLTKSTKFGSVYAHYGTKDSLEPMPALISQSHRFEREVYEFQNRARTAWPINLEKYQNTTIVNGVKPLCAIGNKGLYISAQGQLFPCCWVANRYEHNEEWQQLGNQFDLKKRDLMSVLADPFWSTKFQSYAWQECQTKCAADQVTAEYAQEW